MCLRVRARRFSQRGTGLIEQTMAILRFPGLVLTRQLFDWGTPTGLHGFYRFLPPNPSSDPYTPEMEIYKVFANVSGGMRLPGSGWSDNRDATAAISAQVFFRQNTSLGRSQAVACEQSFREGGGTETKCSSDTA